MAPLAHYGQRKPVHAKAGAGSSSSGTPWTGCRQTPASGVLDPFAINYTDLFVFNLVIAPHWCSREAHVYKSSPGRALLTRDATAAGLSFNGFGVSFVRGVWDWHSPMSKRFTKDVLLSSPKLASRTAITTIMEEDFMSWKPSVQRAADRQLLTTMVRVGAAPVAWGWERALPAPTPDDVAGTEAFLNTTKRSYLDLGIRTTACPARPATKESAICSSLRRTADIVVPRMLSIAQSYIGPDAGYSGYRFIRTPGGYVRRTKAYTSGMWHHDRCGRRVKCFLFWSEVNQTSHPMKFAPGTHNTLYWSYDQMKESRYMDLAVEDHYNVTDMVGAKGDGFCFDTNAIHRGSMDGKHQRDVIIFEFDRAGRGNRFGCPVIAPPKEPQGSK